MGARTARTRPAVKAPQNAELASAARCSPSPTAFSAYVFSQFPTAVSAAVVMNTRVTTIAVVASSRFWISFWVAWVQKRKAGRREV